MNKTLIALAGSILLVILGVVLPRFVIPERQAEWSGPEAKAAQLAWNEVKYSRGIPHRLATTQISVVSVDPDPDCKWGLEQASGIVTVQTYTIFGIPAERWIVTCSSAYQVSNGWWP
ncbi:hypothetical protein BH23CHL1_BH23CHL1_25330 [soil metagenome]